MGLSVLTLVRNRLPHLLQQIEGLRRSTVPPDELIIADMGDEALTLPTTAFAIKVVRLASAGLPLAQARNLAAAQARFEKLLFLDVDCIPMRDLVGQIGQTLDRFDGLLCAQIRYLAAGDPGREWAEEALMRKAVPHPHRHFPERGLRIEPNYGLFWSLAFAIRRDRFRSLGGFDERFLGYGAEDTEFAFRAQDAGIALAFLGGAGALHQHHENFDPPLQHFSDIVRNAQLFYDIRKHWPMRDWLDAFQRLGLIDIEPGQLRILRQPRETEFAAARKADSEPF